MASVSDVRYAQLQYEENRAFGEGLRKQQEGLDQKRGRMGLGRTLLSFAGGAIGTAGGPVGMAIGAGLGSALGSFLGGASTGKIDEIEKGKLYKATADEARRQGRDAQVYMKKMAVRGALSDAASAFFFAGTDIGKAAQVGSAEKLSGLGADANLLQKAWASGSGAVGGGAGHIKGGILNAMRPEATTPVMPELTELQGDTMGDYLQGRVPTGLDPEQIKMTEQAMASGLHPSVAAETAPWSSPSQAIADVAGNDISTKLTIPMAEGKPSSSLNLFNQDIRYSGDLASAASDATSLPTQLANIAQDNATRTTVPLADAMKQYQGPSISGAPGAGMYDPSMGMLSPAEAQIYDFKQSEYYNPYKTGGGDWQEYLRQMRGN